MAVTSGTRLGPYEIQSPLVAGGMGEGYRARDTRLNRGAAIKVLPSHVCADPDLRARFERETKAIVQHPNICVRCGGSRARRRYSFKPYKRVQEIALIRRAGR